jgi:DHA1 family bicyclomycin/chloramphenicol resistance-like MFS transporter
VGFRKSDTAELSTVRPATGKPRMPSDDLPIELDVLCKGISRPASLPGAMEWGLGQVDSMGRASAPVGLTLLLGLLTALGPFAIDMYLPGLPQIAATLHATSGDAERTVSVFFLGMAMGQLFHGPFSDRVGRRLPLFGGVTLFVAASIGCALAPSIEVLWAMRFLQAIGGCAGVVVARAVVRDRYEPRETVRIFSLLTLVLGISPILAPLFGGFVLLVGDWRTVFWILAVLGGGLGVAVAVMLPESRSEETAILARSEHPARSYAALLGNRHVMGFVLVGAFAGAAMSTYVAGSSTLFIGTYHIAPQSFGWVFGANGIGLIAGSQGAARLARHYPPGLVLKVANRITLAVALVLTFDAVTGLGGLWGILVPLFLVITSLGFNQPNALAGAMAEDPRRAGGTSALLGSAQFTVGAGCSWLASALHDGTAKPMAGAITGTVLVAVVLFALMRPGDHWTSLAAKPPPDRHD